MKVTSKQRNSKMCVICGMDNPFGVKAQFYNMEDGSVITPFKFKEEHQSYRGVFTAALLRLCLTSWACVPAGLTAKPHGALP